MLICLTAAPALSYCSSAVAAAAAAAAAAATAGVPMVKLLFGKLVDDGGDAAAERLSAMADAVWPPTAGA
jgi:hypothetical protein